MFDAKIRSYLDPPLDSLASRLTQAGLQANTITVSGFFLGLMAIPLISFHQYDTALIFIALNRILDGLDGAMARQSKVTDLGGYLDIVLDFIFYSGVVFAFALAQPENAVFSALLIFSFIGTGTSFLAFAIFAQKRGITTDHQGQKSIYYLSGLAEGFETIVAISLMCLLPGYFWQIALTFAIICWISTLMRILHAREMLTD